jgi:predicted transcriptional regulator
MNKPIKPQNDQPEQQSFIDAGGSVSPDFEPRHNGTDMSQQAAASIAPIKSKIAKRLHVLLTAHGELTCDEIEVLTGRSHQSVSGSLNGLMHAGWVSKTETIRKTRSGRNARCWKANPYPVIPAKPQKQIALENLIRAAIQMHNAINMGQGIVSCTPIVELSVAELNKAVEQYKEHTQ